jgi:hypothetical protein
MSFRFEDLGFGLVAEDFYKVFFRDICRCYDD